MLCVENHDQRDILKMKNLKLDWNKTKVDAMVRGRGPVKGLVAILVSSKLGSNYATAVSGKSVEQIASTLPQSVGIYAVIPSCNPDEIVSHELSLWDIEELKEEPYTTTSDGMTFYKAVPDHFLCDAMTSAWELFAEQHPVEIVEVWGTATTA